MKAHASTACLLLSACTAVTEFDPAALTEGSDATCGDGADNDGDSLTDCQDFDCLGQRVCCDRTAVILEDDFEAESCTGASLELWRAWGSPLPVVCDGGLWPRKADACYDVGVVSIQSFGLQAGLTVTAGIAGVPEPKGRLEVGLTFQESITGSVDACAPIEGATPFVSVRQVATAGGYQMVARFDERDLGGSAPVTDGDRHEVTLLIDDGGRVHYALDGVGFAVSPEGQPVTSVSRPAYLVMGGRGMTARFTDAVLIAGNQCETPAGWEPQPQFIALTADYDRDLAWDAEEVKDPLVLPDAQVPDLLHLYYVGCNEPTVGHDCDIGHATAVGDGPFARDPVNPVGVRGAPWLADPGPLFSGPAGDPLLMAGPPGAWDEMIGAMTAVVRGDDILLWYVGWRNQDGVRRIGMSRSTDGGRTFIEHPDNPVLAEGEFGSFDDRGVTEPFVIEDAARGVFRMWYIAEGFLGASSSLGYAVSADGIHWVKRDQPVLRPEDLGLISFGQPAVLPGDAGLRLWMHGRWPDDPRHQIVELVNRGRRFDELY